MTKACSAAPLGAGDILVIRGVRVMLDARVAVAFGTQTRRINEAVARNAGKFGAEHVFKLTPDEVRELRSRVATSTSRHGGSRYPPHVFTLKGVARLATVLDTPAALIATDLIIDTFVMVQGAVRRGRRTVAVTKPARYVTSEQARGTIARLKSRLASAIRRLVESMTDTAGSDAIARVSVDIGGDAIGHVRARLQSRALENTKLEADAALILAQAEKVLAEARKTHSEADGLDTDNFEKRIRAVRKAAELIRDIEPPRVISLFEQFDADLLVSAGAAGEK